MNYIIIANGLAGKGIGEETLSQIEQKMIQHGAVKAYLLLSKEETAQVLEQQRDWLDAVVFVGGDGTFREGIRIVSELSLNVPIGLIPMGTGNDFVKTLGIPSRVERAIKLIKDGKNKAVCAYNINENKFLNIASVGLDASIVANQKEIKKRIAGPISYAISTIVSVIKHKKNRHRLIIDGKDCGDDYMLIAFANGKYYGGGMKIAPDASPYVDELQIVALKSVPKILILLLFPVLYFGLHTSLWCIRIWHGNTVEVQMDQQVAINMDGDIDFAKNIKITKNGKMCPKIYLPD